MKKVLSAFALIAMSIVPAYANDSKVRVIQSLYDDADNFDQALYHHSGRELRAAIDLYHRNKSTANETYMYGISNCDETYYFLKPEVGNGYGVEEVDSVFVQPLYSGRVRVFLLGEYVGEVPDYKDFSLYCTNSGTCEITDLYDASGDSAIAAIHKYCR